MRIWIIFILNSAEKSKKKRLANSDTALILRLVTLKNQLINAKIFKLSYLSLK